jgi:hypothetical protein
VKPFWIKLLGEVPRSVREVALHSFGVGLLVHEESLRILRLLDPDTTELAHVHLHALHGVPLDERGQDRVLKLLAPGRTEVVDVKDEMTSKDLPLPLLVVAVPGEDTRVGLERPAAVPNHPRPKASVPRHRGVVRAVAIHETL